MASDSIPPRGIMRLRDVQAETGYSKPSIYRKERKGQFPKRIKLGPGQGGAVGGALRMYWPGLTPGQRVASGSRAMPPPDVIAARTWLSAGRLRRSGCAMGGGHEHRPSAPRPLGARRDGSRPRRRAECRVPPGPG